jgi:hypothetical protein
MSQRRENKRKDFDQGLVAFELLVWRIFECLTQKNSPLSQLDFPVRTEKGLSRPHPKKWAASSRLPSRRSTPRRSTRTSPCRTGSASALATASSGTRSAATGAAPSCTTKLVDAAGGESAKQDVGASCTSLCFLAFWSSTLQKERRSS